LLKRREVSLHHFQHRLKWSIKLKVRYAFLTIAFKSDDFAPVGSAREKALSSTAYSPTGSVYQTVYAYSDGTPDYYCANELSVSGYAVNYCIVASNFAFKFQLTQSSCYGGVTQYFSDKECTNYLGLTSLYGTSTCSQSLDYQHYIGQNAYQNIRCITSGKPVLPTSNYVAQEEFDNTKCSGEPFSYLAFVAGHCFQHKGQAAAYLCNNGVPSLNYYSNAGCTGTLTSSIPYSTTSCFQGDVDIGDDDWEYIPPIIHPPPSVSTTAYPFSSAVTTSSKVFCQAGAPTLKPAFYPTVFPTANVYEQVSFTVTQVIDGIDSATYMSSTMNAYVLVTTIASVMTGVPSSAVINVQIGNTSPTRRRLGDVLEASPQAMAGKAIAATYSIITTTIYSQDQLYSELSNSVNTGTFTSVLNNYATSLGAPNLSGCTSNKVNYYGEGDGSGGSGSLSLSIGAIIGIVVGVLGGITLITALVVWIVVQRRRAKTPLSAQGTYNANPSAVPHPHMHNNMPASAPSPYSPPAPAPLPVANPV